MALVQNVALARVILLVVIGPTHIGLHTTLTTLVQRGSNDAYRGRVFALVGAVTGALFLVGTVGGSVAGGAGFGECRWPWAPPYRLPPGAHGPG